MDRVLQTLCILLMRMPPRTTPRRPNINPTSSQHFSTTRMVKRTATAGLHHMHHALRALGISPNLKLRLAYCRSCAEVSRSDMAKSSLPMMRPLIPPPREVTFFAYRLLCVSRGYAELRYVRESVERDHKREVVR
jgi:hypothetical protein